MINPELLHSVQAEHSVLGNLMLDERNYDEVGHLLKPEHFYKPEHQRIYRAINDLASAKQPFDALCVHDKLKSNNDDISIGYLGQLVAGSVGTNTEHYAKIIAERYVYRNVVNAYNNAAKDLANTELSLEQRANAAASRITDALDGVMVDDEAPTAKESGRDWLAHLEHLFQRGDSMVGIPTGFKDIDDHLKGLSGGELIVIAARPSMGKSAFALNICANVANQGKSVYISSMEMNANAVHSRMSSSITGVKYEDIRTAKMDEIGAGLAMYVGKLSEWKMTIDDSPRICVKKLEAKLRRHRRKFGGLDLVMVDYLGLMETDGNPNQVQAIAKLTRDLKILAGELNVPILLLAQLNRKLEDRTDKRPVMSDLRDSGAIEQDAHTILFVYRDEVYNPDGDRRGITDIIVGKARDAERGVIIPLQTDLAHMRFRNMQKSYFGGDQ